MKAFVLLLLLPAFAFQSKAQLLNCTFKNPQITIHFGRGNVRDINSVAGSHYERVQRSCPNDGYYTYTDYTGNCFNGDWLTLAEDHTPGDMSGNMMVVNSSYNAGTFFSTTFNGLKSGTTYEFAVWLMNVCRISDKCPFPLLPNLSIRLQTRAGKTVAEFNTGDIAREEVPHWTRHKAVFTTPASAEAMTLVMTNNNPGGCGNDFAVDDITFRECVQQTSAPVTRLVTKKPRATSKPLTPKATPEPIKMGPRIAQIDNPKKDPQQNPGPVITRRTVVFPSPPSVLTTRTNAVVKQIDTEGGEININLYDNGEIDGDTVSIYHNNVLLMAHARLSQKPISIRIKIDALHPHHELVMVAENLGSIPPNTSLMIITAGTQRYEVFISSTEQKNAKVILDLKE